MNFSIFGLFAQILEAVKVNDYRGAACGVGRLITGVTCSTQAELLANARPKLSAAEAGEGDEEPSPASPVELYAQTESFTHELERLSHANDHVVRMGNASDAELTPGQWISLVTFVVGILKKFVKKPQDWQPAAFPAPPVSVSNLTGEKPAEPTLPPLVKPTPKPAEPTTVPASGPDAEAAGDEPGDENPSEKPAEKPKAETKKKK